MRVFVRLSPAALRQAMALVAHVLHMPLGEIDEHAGERDAGSMGGWRHTS